MGYKNNRQRWAGVVIRVGPGLCAGGLGISADAEVAGEVELLTLVAVRGLSHRLQTGVRLDQ